MSRNPEAKPICPRAWLVVRRFGVGSEVWMHRQASLMRRLDLRVITNEHADPGRYGPNGFSVDDIGVYSPVTGGKLAWQAKTRLWAWRNRRSGGFRGSPREVTKWAELVERDRPRVALCHYGTWAVRMAPLLTSLGVPVVAHFNGFDLSSAVRGRVYSESLARSAPRWAGCVVVADYMRDWLVGHGCDPARIHKIPYGVPLDEMPCADRVGEQPCRFLMVGRLTPKKRPDLSIRALARCRESGADARLDVVGDGPMLEECQGLAEELGVSDRVEFLGARPFSEVKERIASAGAFVQHSVTADDGDKEGWPVAIAEAAGAGLPIVSTRHASIPEQVDDGVTGLLCDELDWRAMGDHLARLAADPELRQSMGRAGREKISRFDTPGQVQLLEDVLLQAANTAS
ncbi:GDP-mannose-dependent alpha-(1-6)-phosphatidylinositol monomannoside mannosyltransferase [Pseudobythopirellula maris]|uniref:GDP-mannose-dependent alpha-(1-6)-phosphatidylinositol monomannoside mannosyltransferase n=1 Tax=Pseudobythopirellula maris TaxID=2527991 RepID=A0A5C5ZNE4_9BACT|nr:glycosyltransferase family 4 protein [Pseudobythopirellula maris]TWT88688.1 GDP-mannose-dependent alpha-(1-6)-phosphatidylinositol monomannoside mannosyltransferase [Pseudobythopirellula maris]